AFARSVVPERYRLDYDSIVRGMDRGLNGVVRGQLLICLINGLLTYIGLLIFQVNYGVLLAVVVGVMSLIPIFGTIISTLPLFFRSRAWRIDATAAGTSGPIITNP